MREEFKLAIALFCFLLNVWSVHVVTANPDDKRKINIRQATGEIVLDGVPNESDWDLAEGSGNFFQNFPYDTAMAVSKTVVKLTYSEEFLYVAVIGYDLEPGDYTIESFKRDFFGPQNDVVNIVIDPFSDQTNAFLFGISPFGVMREAFINSQAQNSRDAYSWDNKWFAKAKIHDGYWTAEMAIPFKTLRFKEGVENWKINFFRLDSKQNERSCWSRIPRGYSLTDLAFTGDLVWDKPIKKNGGPNISIIPYLAGGIQKDYEAGSKQEVTNGFGGDVKIGLTPSLNLDLTINPDFSQVEVDQQVTNLSRFEIFFPEKRQFFLENADLFENFGNASALPFFSRRIGIAYDSISQQNVQSRVLFGARLSGKLNDNWRVGLLTAQMERQTEINPASQNYTVGVLQRNLFKTSNVSMIFANKQGIEFGAEMDDLEPDYNRVLGLDYNLNSADGVWKGKAFYHQSMTPEELDGQNTYGGFLEYRVSRARFKMDILSVGDNYVAATGFVPRLGYKQLEPELDYNIYPKASIINRHTFKATARYIWDQGTQLTDRRTTFSYEMFFANNNQLIFNVNSGWIRLLDSFDPTNSGGLELEEGTDHNFTIYTASFQTNTIKPFFTEISFNGGDYYNGYRVGTSGNINYRVSPYGIFSMNYSYDILNLPDPYAQTTILLLGPSVEVTLNRFLFLNAIVQYNSQIENFNVNARLQWRFKPASDFFIVYTDNYLPENFKVKNRALVAKLTYWFSI